MNIFRKKETAGNQLVEFQEFFRCEQIFDKFGVSFLKFSSPRINHLRQKAVFTTTVVLTIIVIFLSAVSFFKNFSPDGSIVSSIEASASVGIFGLMLLKMYIVMIKYREPLSDVLSILELHFPTDGWNQHVFKTQKYLKTFKNFLCITVGIYVILWIQQTCLPIVGRIYESLTEVSLQGDFIIQMYLPFYDGSAAHFMTLFLFESGILIIDVIAFLSIDLLYFGLMIVLSMEFSILRRVLSEINAKNDQKEAEKELKILIDVHQELIGCAQKLQQVFSLILFFNIIGMIYLICVTAFLSVSGISSYLLIKYSMPLIASAWNGFIQCYFGDRLIQSSLSVADGAYDSNWYDGSMEYKKLICIVINRSQKYEKITTIAHIDVCLSTYEWIINSAYSYYSVLTALYSS